MNPRFFRWVVGGIVASFAISCATGCGGGSGDLESIWLYFINAYPGAAEVSVIGDTGSFVDGAPFAQRVGPTRYDRSLGGEFTVLLDGSPEPATTQFDLTSLYPNETATMMLTRRSGQGNVDTIMFRHVQTIDDNACALSMYNGLSVENDHVYAFEFSFAPEFRLFDEETEVNRGGWFDEGEIPLLTECGPLPTRMAAGNSYPASVPRDDLLDAINNNPWFFLVDCPDQQEQATGSLCWAWGFPPSGIDTTPTRLLHDSTVATPLNSRDYMDCIQGAIEIKPPEDEMGNPVPFPSETATQCPNDPGEQLTWADVNLDLESVQQCQRLRQTNLDLLEPSSESVQVLLGYDNLDFDEDDRICPSLTFRLRTPGLDAIFGPEGDDSKGEHLDGDFVVSEIGIPYGSEHFYVLTGRPVNPIIHQWNSGENFVVPDNYPAGADSKIGEYETNVE